VHACLSVCVSVADNDTCIGHGCVNNATCKQVLGGYTCGPCPAGFAGLYCQRGSYPPSCPVYLPHYVSLFNSFHSSYSRQVFLKPQGICFYLPWNSREIFSSLSNDKLISNYQNYFKTTFSALTLLVGRQEGHPAGKNWVVGCWRGYLSGVRCWLAYGPADATATHCLLF